MEDLVTAIAMFGNTVVIGIGVIVLYSMCSKKNLKNRRKGDKQYGVFYEIRIDMAINRCVCTWVSWYSDIGQLVCVFDVLE